MVHRHGPTHVGGYRLLRRLGTGGSGTVWEAEDEAGMRVALKMLHPLVAVDEAARLRLTREARLVNQIEGSGTARVLDYEADDSTPFIVTEFVAGPTLAETLTEGPLTVTEVASLGEQLAATLSRVHEAGIAHRDLKPSNVILSEGGPVLIDFGIAQTELEDRLTQTGHVTGTPGFVSPELLSTAGDAPFEAWQQSDWWALSALLLNCLTGEDPFGGGHMGAVINRVYRGEPELEGVPAHLQGVFQAALSPNPQARPSARQVLAALVATPATWPLPPGHPDAAPILEPDASEPGYLPPALLQYPFSAAIFLAWVAVLPTRLGAVGLALALVIFLFFAATGAGGSWVDRRRKLSGTVRSGDVPVAVALFPRHLLLAALQLLPGALLGGAAGVAAWIVYAGGPQVGFASLEVWLGYGTFSGEGGFAFWVLSTLTFAVAYITPTSTFLRRGLRLSVRSALPRAAPRFLLGSALTVLLGGTLYLLQVSGS